VSAVLALHDVSVAFRRGRARPVPVLDRVSFELAPGEILGIVGESGSGKSVTALAIMGLLGERGVVTGGTLTLAGHGDLLRLQPAALRRIRGGQIAMIFQEPMTSLNPLLTVGRQISEAIRAHLAIDASSARQRTLELLGQMGIPAPDKRIDDYPHQMSGGMRQRVMIAIAMACRPRVLIADEPTTALDVTIQAQILALMRRLRDETGSAVLLITHDMGVVAELTDRVVVMYAGQVVETAGVDALFVDPRHPYTRMLQRSIPSAAEKVARLPVIPGTVPTPWDMPLGCRFHLRCPEATDRCRTEPQELVPVANDPSHVARCWRATA
jgi:oligopeptide/dipeptide ABC transporter ATP-binding protein